MKDKAINEIVGSFLKHSISRRDFINALSALGLSSAGITSMLGSAQAAQTGANPEDSYLFTGTGGQLMVEQMKAAGVDYVFANPGTFEVGFFDACLDQPIRIVLCLHEGIVVSAADGYARVSGKPGFVNVHAFASAQAAGQLYNAHYDHSPLVVISGMRLISKLHNSQTPTWPDWSLADVPSRFTKTTWLSTSACDLPEHIRSAINVATTAPCGPVYMAVAETAQTEKNATATILKQANFTDKGIPAGAEGIEAAAKALLNAKNPVIWLGHQVTQDNSHSEAIELAELLSIPVCDSWVWGNSAPFPHRHSLYAGYYNDKGKDLILAFGLVRSDEPLLDNRNVRVIVRCSTNGCSRQHNNSGSMSITANTKIVLRGIIDAVKSMATAAYIQRLSDQRENLFRDFSDTDDLQNESLTAVGPVHPDELGKALQSVLDQNCIFVDENIQGSKQFYNFGPRETDKMLVQNGGGCLGWGLGAAIGAKIANPNRQVVLSIGDGSLMYSAAGFWTMARYEIPVLTVVSNNHNYETVRQAFGIYGGNMAAADRYVSTMIDNPPIDFVGLAKAQGCEGIRVESKLDLADAIQRGVEATRAGVPFVIDVEVQRLGIGADSTWFQEFSIAQSREEGETETTDPR
jgi:acetolactate synthase I/II/III large subunit